jgi:glycosyltransferase involved in cell wall biosynthesis
MHVCLVYDCLYPHTIGGAERWYRNLGERLAARGHEVTYLTLRQWERGHEPRVAGVRVVAVGPRMRLYSGGRRRLLPPLVFGAGVLLHLLRAGRSYDVVHTASFPYFSLLAAAAARRFARFRLAVDWHEAWTPAYWRAYLGPLAGRVGWAVERACARVPQIAFSFSRLHAEHLHEAGLRGECSLLPAQYADADSPAEPEPAGHEVVFAGRHIPEKRLPALVRAVALARERGPERTLGAFGDGPDRGAVLALIAAEGLNGAARAPGFVPREELDAALRRAVCLVLPSSREGYGLVVVEAAARGVPSVVVPGELNAATELVEDGRNGVVAASAEPGDLAEAIVRVHDAGPALRESTLRWFAENAGRLSIERSVDEIIAAYQR